ncbi:MAG: BglG family transcription antiterminator [Erysipelotrichaceae bacterium]|nr:BglG family transcription antiterminator [Erysipelotrichaceae bacterium]
MPNERQLAIIMELMDNAGSYITASALAKEKQVSLRTIQNDMKEIRKILDNEESVVFESSPKGSRLLIKNEADFAKYKESFFLNSTSFTNTQDERVNDLLFYLLNQYRSISLYQLETTLYISHSTLINDLKKARELLQNYNLEILRNANRITLDGSEINKRNCILERNLMVSNTSFIKKNQDISSKLDIVKDLIVQSFVELKIDISDVDLANLVLLLYITIERIKKGFYIQSYDLEISENLEPEIDIARTIFKKIEEQYMLRVTEEEINYLSLYFKGRGGYAEVVISNDTDAMIESILLEIQEKFGFDFGNNLNLRIALALHCNPLFIRIKYNMQLKNPLKEYIRQEYPQGYDLAVVFADRLQNIFHKRITSDEIAFIAIYFYSALSEVHENTSGKRVLVISSNRASENTLIRQTLYKWFSNQISDLRFISAKELEDNPSILDQYDVTTTTEKGKFYDNGIALYINRFPTRNDYLNLKLSLEGLKSLNNILSIFNKDLFFVVDNASKEEVLHQLCDKVNEIYHLDGLYEAVIDREYMRPTFFGNGFAAPHPMTPVSSDTFVSVCLSKTPIEWDMDKNKVQLILLIGIGKNNYNAFHLWNYLSNIFGDRYFVKKLLNMPTYDTFIEMLKEAFAEE